MKGQNIGAIIGGCIIAVIGLYVIANVITTLAPTNALFAQIIFGGGVLAAIVGTIILAIKALG